MSTMTMQHALVCSWCDEQITTTGSGDYALVTDQGSSYHQKCFAQLTAWMS